MGVTRLFRLCFAIERFMDTADPSALPAVSEGNLISSSAGFGDLCVDRLWLEKVIARLSREHELAEEFSRKPIPEPAQRMFLGRASALRFALGLLDESLDPLAFLKQPIPDRHWPPSFRFRRRDEIDRTEEFTASVPLNSQDNFGATVIDAVPLSENSNGSASISPECS